MERPSKGILSFLAIAFGLAWFAWELPVLMGVTLTPRTFQLYTLPGSFAPAIAAIVVRKWITREGFGDAGLRLDVSRWRYFLVAWLAPLAIVCVIAAEAQLSSLASVDFSAEAALRAMGQHPPAAMRPYLGFIVVAQVLFQALVVTPILWGEEFGWRGYLQPRLFPGRPLLAAVATGLIWGAWHYPLIFRGFNYGDQPWLGALIFPVITVLQSIILGWLRDRSGSIWAASLGHASTNAVGGSLTVLWFYGADPVWVGSPGDIGLASAGRVLRLDRLVRPREARGAAMTTRIAPVDRFRAPLYEPLTFPAYRSLLRSGPSNRIAIGLMEDGKPTGLGLAELAEGGEVVVRSIYVATPLRRRGHGAALLEAVEGHAREAGCAKLSAVWMAGLETSDAFEHMLDKQGWEPSQLRMHVLTSDLESIDRSRWLSRVKLEPGFETFSWTELTAAEREALFERQARDPIPQDVWPFSSGRDIEPHSSVGVRHRGEVVGWVVNHPYDADTVRFTCSYMYGELQGRALLVAAYAESINRCRAAGITKAIWAIPVQFPRMIAFSRRHLVPYATSLTETRGSTKRLDSVA